MQNSDLARSFDDAKKKNEFGYGIEREENCEIAKCNERTKRVTQKKKVR